MSSAAGLDGALLEVRNLSTDFFTERGVLHAVDDVSLDLQHGETLGLVGESGCGKSMTALSIMRLVPTPGRIVSGSIRLSGRDLLELSEDEMRGVRGSEIGFIFQDPISSLNPALTIGYQISEPIRVHLGFSRRAASDRAAELLTKVGIPRARASMDSYPFQFSGGMAQRAMIAMALSCDPKLLLADEPTTALDVTIQAQILELIASIADDFGTAVLLITHDLGIAAGMCKRVNVMYAGRIVEAGAVDEIFDDPQMPYSWGLLGSIPRLDEPRGTRLRAIHGLPPDLIEPEDECRFRPRCAYARQKCRDAEPFLTPRGPASHHARCWGTESGGWITGERDARRT